MGEIKRLNTILNGCYEIVSGKIDGGSANIYKARHIEWNIDVALKIPNEEYISSVGKDEFEKECDNWIKLGAHPNIAMCYLVTKLDGDLVSISEWADGGTLKDAITGKTLYEAQDEQELQKRLLKIAAQILSGIKYAHSRGIVHRDIKPHNILMTDNNIRITDFGLSTGTAKSFSRAYASPEQISNQDTGFASDIYSWAITVMEMYTGECGTRNGIQAGLKADRLLSSPENKAAVPPEIKKLLLDCLDQSPGRRPSADKAFDSLGAVYEKLTGEKLSENISNIDMRTAGIENNRAIACIELNETEKAFEHWKKALKIDPLHAESFFNSEISKNEVWLDRLEQSLRGLGASEKSHRGLFEQINRAKRIKLKTVTVEDCGIPFSIAFDEIGRHIIVKYENGVTYLIDKETLKIRREDQYDLSGSAEECIPDDTDIDSIPFFEQKRYFRSEDDAALTAVCFGLDSVSVGRHYEGKTYWIGTFYLAKRKICVSPKDGTCVINCWDPSQENCSDLVILTLPDACGLRYVSSEFKHANKLQNDLELVNSLYDRAKAHIDGGDIPGALRVLDEIERAPYKDIKRYFTLKHELGKHCGKKAPRTLFLRRLDSAPEFPCACAVSSDLLLYAFLLEDASIKIYEAEDSELKLKTELKKSKNFALGMDTEIDLWFAGNNKYLAIRRRQPLFDQNGDIAKVDYKFYTADVETGVVLYDEAVNRLIRKTAPPEAPPELDIAGNDPNIRVCFSEDGCAALSYKYGCPNSALFIDPSEDGHPILYALDHSLEYLPKYDSPKDSKITKRKRRNTNMAHENKHNANNDDDCYNIKNSGLQGKLEANEAANKQIYEHEAEDEDEDVTYDIYDDIYGYDESGYDDDFADDETLCAKRRQQLPVQVKNLNLIRENLIKNIIGQEHAVHSFIRGLFRTYIDDDAEIKKGPKAIFTFMGPPGMGKSLLAESVTGELNKLEPDEDHEWAYKRFDMSEFGDKNSFMNLIGSESGYTQSMPGVLTEFVHYHPKCILLFDEIEKAHEAILKLFYQILDAGFLTDKFQETYNPNNKERPYEKWDARVSFKETMIIFTSNVGRSVYEDPDFTDGSTVSEQTLINALATEKDPEKGPNITFFPTALVSRLSKGTIIMFNNLGPDSLSKIAHSEFRKNAAKFRKKYNIDMPSDSKFEMAMLYSLGGKTDARRLTSKVNSFISDEVFKIVSNDADFFKDVNKLKFTVELPKKSDGANDNESREIRQLFVPDTEYTILAYVDNIVAKELKELENKGSFKIIHTDNAENAKAYANTQSFDLALIDIGLRNNCGDPGKTSLFSADAKRWSDGKGVFDSLRKSNPDKPVFILNNTDGGSDGLPETLVLEFISGGAADSIKYDGDSEAFAERLSNAAVNIHLQRSASLLATGHRQLCFSSVFETDEKSRTGTVKLRNLSLERAALADDIKTLLKDINIPKVRFSDVIGVKPAVETLKDYKKFFENPREFTAGGRKAPKGVLLYGKPGTGKTMLAKAMAGECGVAFIEKPASELHSPEEVRKLFNTARKYAPAIIFLDEVDTVAKARTGQNAYESVLNTLLTEMDGFKSDAKRPVFVLAATNFGVNPVEDYDLAGTIDAAFCRRFDQCIRVNYPDKYEIKELIDKKLTSMSNNHITAEELDNLSKRMLGSSPSDIMRVLEAALSLAHNDNADPSKEIKFSHINTAFENIKFGEQHTNKSYEELLHTAYHEAGHTLIYFLSGYIAPFITVEARGRYGGYMQRCEEEINTSHRTRKHYHDSIRCSLGGRAAEMVVYGEEGITSGASADLKHATDSAYEMVTQLGMDDKIGLAVFKGCSPEASIRINTILEEELNKAKEFITANRDKLDKLAKTLAEKKHLLGHEIERLLSNKPESGEDNT